MTIDKQKKTAARKKIKEQHRKEKKDFQELKESFKTAGKYINEAQAAVNKYVRLRDQGKPCISCAKLPEQGKEFDAGHYRSRGAASHLRFNLFNIHAQCINCNRFGCGSNKRHRINLIKEIGLKNLNRLEADYIPRKFTIDYLKMIKNIFDRRFQHLHKLRS